MKRGGVRETEEMDMAFRTKAGYDTFIHILSTLTKIKFHELLLGCYSIALEEEEAVRD